jgi:hypothetical protein
LQINLRAVRRMRGSLASKRGALVFSAAGENQTDGEEDEDNEGEQEQRPRDNNHAFFFTQRGVIVTIEVSIAADRQGDIDSATDLFTKLASGEASSEIVIAAEQVVQTICSDVSSKGEADPKQCSLKAEKPTVHETVLDAGSGSEHTNATQVAEAATAGNLTDIGAAINAEDTPDIASAVEAQKMEEVLSEETPRQSRPDQSLPGPPFPGAWGTVE